MSDKKKILTPEEHIAAYRQEKHLYFTGEMPRPLCFASMQIRALDLALGVGNDILTLDFALRPCTWESEKWFVRREWTRMSFEVALVGMTPSLYGTAIRFLGRFQVSDDLRIGLVNAKAEEAESELMKWQWEVMYRRGEVFKLPNPIPAEWVTPENYPKKIKGLT